MVFKFIQLLYVGWNNSSKSNTIFHHISPYCRLALVLLNFMKFGIRGQLSNVILCVKFLVNRFRGYRNTPNCPFPLTCCIALTTMYALPCDTVMLLRLWYVQWAPEDTSTPIKPDSQAASRKAPAASRTLDETDRSLAAAGIQLASSHWESSIIHKIDKNQPPPLPCSLLSTLSLTLSLADIRNHIHIIIWPFILVTTLHRCIEL